MQSLRNKMRQGDADGNINGIPQDGGFGHKNLAKFDDAEASRGVPHAADPNVRSTDYATQTNTNTNTNMGGTYDNYDNNAMGGGAGPQAGGMYNEQPGFNDNTHTRPPRQEQPGVGPAGSGGFISQSHGDRLGREAEMRRQQQGTQFGGNNTNTAEYDAMGFDTPAPAPPARNANTMSPPTDNLTNTSGTGTNMNTSGGGAGLVPHNSLSLSEQAAIKARESEAMQKQAVEVGKAEELEKAALAARQR
ncbi:hypothetical protein DL93DRAFT_2091021, partial [Clavulina sp. PMI_390]